MNFQLLTKLTNPTTVHVNKKGLPTKLHQVRTTGLSFIICYLLRSLSVQEFHRGISVWTNSMVNINISESEHIVIKNKSYHFFQLRILT